MLRSLQAHSHYWDHNPEGSGCQSLIYGWMRDNTLLSNNIVGLQA
ncbi:MULTISPECIES: hypothetical protein [unclassified Chryseobacterium]|nr:MULTISPECIES: hypothetical protein [unclassified Chryseobacterium]